MAPRPATIESVVRIDRNTNEVVALDLFQQEKRIALPLLGDNTSDLKRVFAYAFPGAGTVGRSKSEMLSAITSGKLTDGEIIRKADEPLNPPARKDGAKPLALGTPHAARPEQPRPAAAPQEAAQALADALTLFQQPAAVDPETVREIVRDETKHLARPLAIHVPERPEPIILKDRTHHRFTDVLACVAVGEHVMLTGPAGTGKSTLAKQVAKALGLAFSAISLNPDTPEHAFFGYQDANGTYHRTEFRDRFENGGVFLCDEIDNGHTGITSGLNQAMANGECAFPDGMVPRHPEFVVIATANTWGTGATAEYMGRNPMDAATLDRFAIIEVTLDEQLEREMIKAACPEHGDEIARRVAKIRDNVTKAGLRVLVTPRGAVGAAKLVKGGMDWKDALRVRLVRGLPDEQFKKVTDGVLAAL